MKLIVLPEIPLCEKCPNTEYLLVRIFPHSDWMRRDTSYLSVFSPNTGKYRPANTPYLDTFHAVIHLYSWWFMGISSIRVADFWATLLGSVIWGALLDRTFSKNWFAPNFCAYRIKLNLKSSASIVLLLSCFILSRRFSMKSVINSTL